MITSSPVCSQPCHSLLSRLIAEMPTAIAMVDRNLCYLVVSQRWLNHCGLPQQDLIGRSHYDCFPNVPHTWKASLQECLTHDRTCRMEDELILANGKTAWMKSEISPWHTEDGSIGGLILSYEEITFSQQAQHQIRQGVNYQALVDSVQEIIWSLDAKGRFTFVNAATQSFLGYDPQAVIGRHLTDFLSPEKFQQDLNAFQQMLQGKAMTDYESFLVHKSGEHIPVNVSAIAVYDQAGNPIGINGVTTDLRDRKRTEEDLKEQVRLSGFRAAIDSRLTRSTTLESMLQECAEEIQRHLDTTFVHFWLIDASQQSLDSYAVAGALSDCELTHPRIAFDSTTLLGRIAHDYQPMLTNALSETLWFDDRTWIESNSLRSFAGFPIALDGEMLGVVAIVSQSALTDVTIDALYFVSSEVALGIKRRQAEAALQAAEAQQRQQAEALARSLEELQHTQTQLVQNEKMSSLGQLVAGVAHEINNPVNFIFGNVSHANAYSQDLLTLLRLYQAEYPRASATIEQAIEKMDLEFLVEDLPKVLHSMRLGAERIQKIVLALRNFSRMDESDLKDVNLHEGLDSTLMILQHRLKETSTHPEILVQRAYGELPIVACLAGQLNQVFMNILVNAIDALDECQAKGQLQQPATIHIRTQVLNGDWVEVQISDNGPGIPAETQKRLFEPFFTTKEVGKGTGLGLSISYQIVTEKHGGKLLCTSEFGKGTTFMVQIPMQPISKR